MGDWDIRGKTVLLTGGTTGIGRATVEALADRDADVIFTCRSEESGQGVVDEIRRTRPAASVDFRLLHLDDLGSVRALAEELCAERRSLDVLINNAGVMSARRRETVDGFEYTIGVNHLGHFLLVSELLPLLTAAGSARVVIVASDAHRFVKRLDFDDLHNRRGRYGAWRGLRVYSQSKLANILHTRGLALRIDDSRVTVNCVHPGAVKTRLARDSEQSRLGEALWPVFGRVALSPESGARTSVWAATSPELTGVTGAYLARSRIATAQENALDVVASARLWSISEELVG